MGAGVPPCLAGVSARVRASASGSDRFREWVASGEKAEGTPRERAIAWRAIEIIIERERKRPNRGLFDDTESLAEVELEERQDRPVQQAAELFLAREYDIPYYFGPERIARLGSLNIQQFLGLSGDLFEEVAAASLLRQAANLSPRRQHDLMKAAARAVWNEIPRRVRHGHELRNLLDSIGRFSQGYTYRPTAPNDPGVGGTAIRMSERARLLDPDSMRGRPELERLADVLASALAHNLLVADLDYSCKKEKWMVLNLNRLLCVHFDLPLGYGLYKERPMAELCRWIEQPFTAPSTRGAWYDPSQPRWDAAMAELRPRTGRRPGPVLAGAPG